MTNKGGFLYLPIVKSIDQILRHRRVGHLRRTGGKTVVAHINLQNIVVVHQVAGEDAQVVETTKQTVNQDNRGIIVRILCRLRAAI